MLRAHPSRRLRLALATLALAAGCRGAVTARGMKALGPWSDREVALEGAREGEDEAVAWARVGAVEGMKQAGLAVTKDGPPGALVVRVRELRPDEGRATLLSSPTQFAADKAKVAVVGGASFVGRAATSEKVKDAAGLVTLGVGGSELVKEAARVRVALELFAPEREVPVGAVVWEGWRNLDRQGAAEKAGREAGEVLADEIASQRLRWVDRRPASERLFLTTTPLLLEPGEAVISLDQGLLLHAGVGVKRWLQLDLSIGGTVVPTAGGLIHSTRGGATVVGTFALGFKVRIADEGPYWPGVSASYERLSLWSGAIGSGRVAVLDHVVDTGSPDASSGFGLNVLTLALSKHPTEWLQVGGGLRLVDDHPIFGSRTPVVDVGGGGRAERLPTALMPWVDLEARAGEHFRFIGEYLISPGADAVSLGVRTVFFGSRTFGVVRTSGWRARLDTAVVVTGRDGGGLAALPWIGVAVYPR
jgi:hypothetical protein